MSLPLSGTSYKIVPTDPFVREFYPVHSSENLLNECSFVSAYFTSAAWVDTYSVALPVVLFDNLASSLSLNPPPLKTGHGRVKRKRGIAGQAPSAASQMRGDAPSQGVAIRRSKGAKCSRCNEQGHNVRTCSSQLPVDDPWVF